MSEEQDRFFFEKKQRSVNFKKKSSQNIKVKFLFQDIDCLHRTIVNVYIFYDINLTENSRECAMALKECTVDYCISY